jgi:hypothetical protein
MNLSADTDGLALMPWLILRGLSFGMIAIPVQTLATQRITGAALAKATSLFNMIRQVAQSVGNAIVISLFAQQIIQHANELREQMLKALPAGATLNSNSPQAAALRDQLLAKAGTASVNDVFTILTSGAALMILLALALPNRKRQAEEMEANRKGEINLEAGLMG